MVTCQILNPEITEHREGVLEKQREILNQPSSLHSIDLTSNWLLYCDKYIPLLEKSIIYDDHKIVIPDRYSGLLLFIFQSVVEMCCLYIDNVEDGMGLFSEIEVLSELALNKDSFLFYHKQLAPYVSYELLEELIDSNPELVASIMDDVTVTISNHISHSEVCVLEKWVVNDNYSNIVAIVRIPLNAV